MKATEPVLKKSVNEEKNPLDLVEWELRKNPIGKDLGIDLTCIARDSEKFQRLFSSLSDAMEENTRCKSCPRFFNLFSIAFWSVKAINAWVTIAWPRKRYKLA